MPKLLAFAAALLVSLVTTPLVRRLALRYELKDHPHERKVHDKSIPHLGGIAIFLGFLSGFAVFWYFDKPLAMLILNRFWGVFVGAFIIILLGIYDDIKGANFYQKFTGQILAAGFVVWSGYTITAITNPFGGQIMLGILAVPATILWIVSITNAINLLDGLDGLAAGVSIIVCFTLLLISYNTGSPNMMNVKVLVMTIILIGAIIGFLRYNFNPAVIFMGDTGSLFLGFTISCIALEGSYTAPTTVAILVPIIALGVPIIDMILAIYRRTRKGTHPFRADREHVHHKLLDLGMSHKNAVIVIYFITVLFCIIAILLTAANSRTSALLLLVIGAIVFIGVRRLGYFEAKALLWTREKEKGPKRDAGIESPDRSDGTGSGTTGD